MEITYLNSLLLPMGKLRPRKDGDVARVTKAEVEPGSCSQHLDLGLGSKPSFTSSPPHPRSPSMDTSLLQRPH